MPTSQLSITGDVAGIPISGVLSRTADGQIGHDPVLPAAMAGTGLVNNGGVPNTWTFTLPAGHGIVIGDNLDLYWASGRRYGMEVTAVVTNDVTVKNSTTAPNGGDAMPADGTALTVARQTEIDTDFDGDRLTAIAAACATRGHLTFENTGGTSALSVDLVAAEAWFWLSGGTAANPLASQVVDKVLASQAETGQTPTLKLGILYDSTV